MRSECFLRCTRHFGVTAWAWAVTPAWAAQEREPANPSAIVACIVVLLVVLAGARWAADRAYAALHAHAHDVDRNGLRGGFALAGVYLSAGAFLSIPALMSVHGNDMLILVVGLVVGWPLLAFLLAERLHNLSVLTFTDALCWRLQQPALRALLAISTLIVCLVYLVAQIVGAGQVVSLLFGFEYWLAAVISGGAMMAYTLSCGRIALTWLAIVKVICLLVCMVFLAGLTVWEFGWGMDTLHTRMFASKDMLDSSARQFPGGAMRIGMGPVCTQTKDMIAQSDFFRARDPISIISLGLTLVFGVLGLPHILMRFAHARSARIARQSTLWGSILIGVFAVLLGIVGLGLVRFSTKTQFMNAFANQGNNGDLALLFLAYLLGNDLFMGIIAAAVLVTLLAVTVGLGHAVAAAVAHDLYATIFKRGRENPALERRIAHVSTISLFILAILLGVACAEHSIAAIVTLAFVIAASVNAPVLLMAMFWKGCTSRGAFAGGVCGLFCALFLILCSPFVWEQILHQHNAPFVYALPTLFSMSVACIGVWLFSLADRSHHAAWERAAWPAQQFRATLGLGAPPVFTGTRAQAVDKERGR